METGEDDLGQDDGMQAPLLAQEDDSNTNYRLQSSQQTRKEIED